LLPPLRFPPAPDD